MSNVVDYEINKELGECYLLMGDYEKARQYYNKAILGDKNMVDPYLGIAAIELQIGNLSLAYEMYQKANSIQETDKTLAGMAMIEVEKKEFDSALQKYAQALSYNPNNMLVLNNMVQLCHFLQKLDFVVPYLEAALQVEEDNSIRYALAACLLSLDRAEESRGHLELLLGQTPDNQDAQKLYASLSA